MFLNRLLQRRNEKDWMQCRPICVGLKPKRGQCIGFAEILALSHTGVVLGPCLLGMAATSGWSKRSIYSMRASFCTFLHRRAWQTLLI